MSVGHLLQHPNLSSDKPEWTSQKDHPASRKTCSGTVFCTTASSSKAAARASLKTRWIMNVWSLDVKARPMEMFRNPDLRVKPPSSNGLTAPFDSFFWFSRHARSILDNWHGHCKPMQNHPVAKPGSTTRFVVSKKWGDPKTLKQWDFGVPPIPPLSLWETHRWRIFSPNSPMSHTCLNRQQAVSQVRDAALVAPVAGLDSRGEVESHWIHLWSLFNACFHGNCKGWFNLPCFSIYIIYREKNWNLSRSVIIYNIWTSDIHQPSFFHRWKKALPSHCWWPQHSAPNSRHTAPPGRISMDSWRSQYWWISMESPWDFNGI